MMSQPSKNKARVLLVEDHPVVRRGLAALIDDEQDLVVCGEAEDSKQASDLVRSLRPDVVILDISLGAENGLELIRTLHSEHPELPILALSMHDESLYAERAIRAGAMGYIMKKEAMDRVMEAIRQVLTGELSLSTRITSRIVRKLVHRPGTDSASPLESLSDREFQVFGLIAEGIGPTEIAERLGVSVKTIETHREHVKTKLNLRNASELTRFALKWSMEAS